MSATNPKSQVDQPTTPLAELGLLGWALPTWVFSGLFAGALSLGLSEGLRGAQVGLGALISTTDWVADVASQFCAVSTILLLTHLSLRCLRYFRSLLAGFGTIVLGILSGFQLVLAHRISLPDALLVSMSLGSAAIVLACAYFTVLRGAARSVLSLVGISLLAHAGIPLLAFFGSYPIATRLTAAALPVLGLAVLLLIFVLEARKRRPLLSLTAIATSTLLYFAAQAPYLHSTPLVVLRRSINAMLHSTQGIPILAWGLITTTGFLLLELFSTRPARDTLIYAAALLGLFAPMPLLTCALALVALALVELQAAPTTHHL